MPIHDFALRRRIVREGERRWCVSPPNLETIIACLDEFGQMIQHIGATEGIQAEMIAKAIAQIDPIGAQAVLMTCVDGPEHGDWPVETLALAALSLCDVKRIAASFAEKKDAKKSDTPGITPLESFVISVAERFSVTPMDVMRWPYEALLTLSDEAKAVAQPSTTDAFREASFRATPFRPQKFVESPPVN